MNMNVNRFFRSEPKNVRLHHVSTNKLYIHATNNFISIYRSHTFIDTWRCPLVNLKSTLNPFKIHSSNCNGLLFVFFFKYSFDSNNYTDTYFTYLVTEVTWRDEIHYKIHTRSTQTHRHIIGKSIKCEIIS